MLHLDKTMDMGRKEASRETESLESYIVCSCCMPVSLYFWSCMCNRLRTKSKYKKQEWKMQQ